LTSALDDGSVVVMSERITTVWEYLGGDETTRPQELAYGILREPPAPGYSHQVIVGRIYELLKGHVRRSRAGRVVISPVDVVLDRERHLVVQPDVVFISEARLGICKERIWGAPDLVVEVLSSATRRHDCTTKVTWFKEYGVRECWLVDPVARTVDVLNLALPDAESVPFESGGVVRSTVLPRLRLRVDALFSH
jgi:Uma2 family endonuclease